MKVLILADKEKNIEEIIEIVDAAYEYNLDITGENPDGPENSGLSIVDVYDEWRYIKGVSKEECNRICQELYENDKVDLRKYGECAYA